MKKTQKIGTVAKDRADLIIDQAHKAFKKRQKLPSSEYQEVLKLPFGVHTLAKARSSAQQITMTLYIAELIFKRKLRSENDFYYEDALVTMAQALYDEQHDELDTEQGSIKITSVIYAVAQRQSETKGITLSKHISNLVLDDLAL